MENIRKTSYLFSKHLKSICSWPKTFEMMRKNENQSKIVWKMFQTLQEYTLGILWPLQSSKKQISSIFGFSGFSDTRSHHFGPKKISKSLQKMTKERWKNKEKWKYSNDSLNTSRMHPRTITAFKNRNVIKIVFFIVFHTPDKAILSSFWT